MTRQQATQEVSICDGCGAGMGTYAIYTYDADARWAAVWGCLVRPTLVREIEPRDPFDYDDGAECPGGDA